MNTDQLILEAHEVLPDAFARDSAAYSNDLLAEIERAVEMDWETDEEPLRAAIRRAESFPPEYPDSVERFSESDREHVAEAEAANREGGLDVFAFYVSFHKPALGSRWGIFYYAEGIRRLTLLLMCKTNLSWHEAEAVAQKLLRTHERFHFRFDLGSLHDELLLRTPLYNTYTRQVYQQAILTPDCFEESLANRAVTSLRFDVPAVLHFVQEFLKNSPPGYRDFDRDSALMRECLLGQLRTASTTARIAGPEREWVAEPTRRRCPEYLIRAPVLPSGKFIKCKQRGRIWIVHPNDFDPWPSQPHGHEYERREKLDLSTGEIFSLPSRQLAGRLRPRDLNDVRTEISHRRPSLVLPPVVV